MIRLFLWIYLFCTLLLIISRAAQLKRLLLHQSSVQALSTASKSKRVELLIFAGHTLNVSHQRVLFSFVDACRLIRGTQHGISCLLQVILRVYGKYHRVASTCERGWVHHLAHRNCTIIIRDSRIYKGATFFRRVPIGQLLSLNASERTCALFLNGIIISRALQTVNELHLLLTQ